MNRISKLLTLALALLTITLTVAVAIPVAAADDSITSNVSAAVPTPLIITEVCYNPTFMENDMEDVVSATADVLEFVEVYNPSSEAVFLKDAVLRYSKTGYEGEFLENALVAVSTSSMTVAPRGVAIICIYGKDAANFGLTYDTDEGIEKIFDVFSQINVNLADTVKVEDFIIAPRCVSGSTDKVSDKSFNLDNSATDAVVRVVSVNDGAETLLCEAHYNAELWNRNICSVNMIYDPAADPDHPGATVPFNESYPTPGYLFDNQYPDAVLTVDKATEKLLVLEYNVCATDSTQTHADGSAVTIGERMDKLESMIAQYQPDVIGLPEFNDLWLPEMKEYLATEDCAYTAYGCSSQGREFGKKDTSTTWDLINLIMYNKNKYDLVDEGYFWCSMYPDRRNSFTWEDGTVGDFARCINWVILRDKETRAEFLFLCAHIDAKVPLARTYSTALITKKATELAGGRPVIMTGDWNCHESTEAYWNLHKDGYGDARYLTDSVANMSIYSTMNKWGESTDLQTRPAIDHCIISKDSVMVNSAHRDMGEIEAGIYASDHNATVYDLSYVNINAKEEETVADTTVPETNAPTEPVTEQPVESVTDTPAAEETTVAEAETDDTAKKGGCASAVTVSAVFIVAVVGAVLMKKRED